MSVSKLVLSSLGLVAFAVAGAFTLSSCGDQSAPAEPSFVDVQEILQGKCLHCHGSTAAVDGSGLRFDFRDARRDCGDLADDAKVSAAVSIVSAFLSVPGEFEPADGQGPKMPPLPARPLEAWQLETLENYFEIDSDDRADEETPDGNREPTFSVVSAVKRRGKLVVTVDVSDANGDAVLGLITADGKTPDVNDGDPTGIDRTGRHELTYDIDPDGAVEIEAELCDGWSKSKDSVDVDVD